jgi:hypothetical protein
MISFDALLFPVAMVVFFYHTTAGFCKGCVSHDQRIELCWGRLRTVSKYVATQSWKRHQQSQQQHREFNQDDHLCSGPVKIEKSSVCLHLYLQMMFSMNSISYKRISRYPPKQAPLATRSALSLPFSHLSNIATSSRLGHSL